MHDEAVIDLETHTQLLGSGVHCISYSLCIESNVFYSTDSECRDTITDSLDSRSDYECYTNKYVHGLIIYSMPGEAMINTARMQYARKRAGAFKYIRPSNRKGIQ